MATLSFETLHFQLYPEYVKVVFLKYYFFTIPLSELQKIGSFTVTENSITFPAVSEKTLQNKFSRLLEKGFEQLTGIFTRKRTFYIHKQSGIPLLGSRYIGILDRGTNFLELKPITGCTMGCTFCSVDEGIGSKKQYDFLVDREYLIQETRKLLAYKDCKNIHIYINVHGEPLLYPEIVPLIRDIMALPHVKESTIITTGVLLTEQMIDALVDAGLTTLNISLSAMDIEKAKQIMGNKAYNVEQIKHLIQYASKNIKVIIAPVWMDAINDAEMEKIAAFGKEISCPVRIQKFCYNKFGRNPVEELSWEEFFAKIATLEKKIGIQLKDDAEAYHLEKTKELPIPFKKGERIEAQIIGPGRYSHERLCVTRGRLISVPMCKKENGKVKVKIVKTTHNVIIAQ